MEPTTKTWGPFNGRQLTIIICVLAATMLLIPAGAWAAVSFTNVAITGPGGVNRAKVDDTGRLAVGDGSGPFTVDGTVATSLALPTKPITIQAISLPPTYHTIYGPQSKSFGIGSLTVTGCNSSGVAHVSVRSHLNSGGAFTLYNLIVAPNQTVHLDFPIPLVLTPPPGDPVSLEAGIALFDCAILSAVGAQS